RPLNQMLLSSRRRAMELAEMIDRLGGQPPLPPVQPEEQYLAFLTIKFLLPKLAEAKRLIIERFVNTLQSLRGQAPGDVIELLESQLAEHRADLTVLQERLNTAS